MDVEVEILCVIMFIVEIYTNLSNDSFINFAGSGNSE